MQGVLWPHGWQSCLFPTCFYSPCASALCTVFSCTLRLNVLFCWYDFLKCPVKSTGSCFHSVVSWGCPHDHWAGAIKQRMPWVNCLSAVSPRVCFFCLKPPSCLFLLHWTSKLVAYKMQLVLVLSQGDLLNLLILEVFLYIPHIQKCFFIQQTFF